VLVGDHVQYNTIAEMFNSLRSLTHDLLSAYHWPHVFSLTKNDVAIQQVLFLHPFTYYDVTTELSGTHYCETVQEIGHFLAVCNNRRK
jgi:hypothetical protein